MKHRNHNRTVLTRTYRFGFTLIELLVVVAIIAILAAIAVPNFLEAQIRAKASRVKTELRTLAVAIESYQVDHNHPPYDGEPGGPHWGWTTALGQITTPVAFLTSIPGDPFQDIQMKSALAAPGTTYFLDVPSNKRHGYDYGTAYWQNLEANPSTALKWRRNFGSSLWKIGSCGPDKTFQPSPDLYYGLGNAYDPTNGTISEGDIYRAQYARD